MAASLEKVYEEVLKRVTPSESQRRRILELAEKLRKKVVKAAAEEGIKAKVRIEGSIAKDTWLSDEPEIDIFMQLPPTIPRKDLGTVCLKIARKATKGSKQIERFAEHPYLEAFVNNVRVNIVPCYEAKPGEWLSATDRTPFHTDYVKPRLNEKLCGEIRVLKKFMKGIGVYGAEIKVGGFSGYLCELLILYYKSFANTLKSVANWRIPQIIDCKYYYKGREKEIPLIFPEPLVLIDPVDKGRNVASAVRKERLFDFIAASNLFLKKPGLKFFYPPETKPFTVEEIKQKLKNRGSSLVFIKFGKVEVVSDVLWGQLYKSQKSLRKMLVQNEFNIIRDGVWSNEDNLNLFIFEVENHTLPPLKKHFGPPLEKQTECEKFLKKHLNAPQTISGPYIENGRWVVETTRKHASLVELLKEKLSDGGRRVGIAESIAYIMPKTLEILLNEEVLKLYTSNREFAKFLTEYFHGKPTWLT
jgi:tRNA nucleotidyltransferase (CCA-adding enzyme)